VLTSLELERAIANCCRFQRLLSITISFGIDLGGHFEEMAKAYDSNRTINFQTRILLRLVSALSNAIYITPYFRTLCIVGVANHDCAALIIHPKFCSVFERLRGLKLHFVTDELRFREWGSPHLFFGDCTPAWFAPFMSNLTTLELLSESYWGYWPRIDLTPLFFPRLQVLALGKYTFTHTWQLKWVTKHGNLRKLYLYDCPIVSRIHLLHDFDKDGYPISGPGSNPNGPERVREYPATWANYLDEIRKSLLELQVFNITHENDLERRVSQPNVNRRQYFETYEYMKNTSFSVSRYLEWDASQRWTQWNTYFGASRNSFRGDFGALESLLHTVKSRRRIKNTD